MNSVVKSVAIWSLLWRVEVENRKIVFTFLRLRLNSVLKRAQIKRNIFHKLIFCSICISESRIRQNKLISVDPQYDDDGIGTSDDETNSNTSNVKPCDDDDNENVAECDDADDSDDKSKSRRVIKPDMTALNRLLAFDEVTIS